MVNEKELPTIFGNLLFPKVFQTFRMAIQPTKLIIGLLAVAIIFLTGRVMDLIYQAILGPQDAFAIFSNFWVLAVLCFHGSLKSLFAFDLPGVAENISNYFKTVGATFADHYIYCIIFCAIKLAVISIFGGAICRIAALQLARGEKPGLTEALRYSTKKFTSFFTAPLAPIGIIIFIGFFIFLLGLVGNIPKAGELIMGIFMFLAFIAGVLIAIVLIGAVAGLNLMFPAVAYDGSDCFDAISRAFSYVYSRPWRMGFYSAIAVVYGAICYIFVRFFTFLSLWVTHRALQLGVFGDNSKLTALWPEPSFGSLLGQVSLPAGGWAQSIAAVLIYLCLLVVTGLVVSFLISFYFSANTIIYALMRNRVDNTALDDVYSPTEEGKSELPTTESNTEHAQPEPESKTESDSSASERP